ncbi:hypothetical protein RHODGE_RHODGE_02368 [Rhodoplanes serenus]|jgi:tripartite-type tricarboxylate transporter receptor subunit TctC|uniref:ABC transporter substrate-binding protein n=1 Tax=Rhodoplanes serenus TaxID=200615 RepID=A0A3S4B1A4_9BRAD|nr:tripartite tricarboxylate transporter substrate binding protein [Rhodoplanes serenus]VCU09196.1 hypothetical protein RHODGE_RHODGE_02368 [Rhodoplanes serenus]
MLDRRRVVLAALAAAAAPAVAGPAAAQATYPARPVTVVVPYPPAGSVDLVARAIGEPVSRSLGQPVVVENRGGSGGSVAAQAVALAEPDGYRLVLGTQQTHATNEALFPSIGYRAVESFTPICQVCTVPHALVVKKTLPVASAAELVELLKREPGRLNYGSTGNGSSSHLACELFQLRAGVKAQHVPYRGGGPLAQDLMAGVVDFGFIAVANIRGPLEGGLVRGLAIASAKRIALMPELPTLAETGLPDVDADAWFAYFAPARTPPERIAMLAKAIEEALAADSVRETFDRNAVVARFRPSAEMPEFVAAEVRKWAEVVRLANVKAE